MPNNSGLRLEVEQPGGEGSWCAAIFCSMDLFDSLVWQCADTPEQAREWALDGLQELRDDINAFLGENGRDATHREPTIRDAVRDLPKVHCTAMSHEGDIILFGAGDVGHFAIASLEAVGRHPVAFADNNERLWGHEVCGLPVLSPDEAAKRYPDGKFVLSVGGLSKGAAISEQLAGLFRRIADYRWFTPIPQDEDFGQRLQSVWADEQSRRVCVSRLGSFPVPCPTSDPDEIYFPRDLFRLHDHEVFVDCGAFDGDTFLEFRQRVDGFVGYHAFEPDPTNYRRLVNCLSHYPVIADKITHRQVAVNDGATCASFSALGTVSSGLTAHGNIEVSCCRLDDVAFPEPPTFVKMDIEGGEVAALRGAEKLIREHRPILAICTYHRPNHIWEVPLWIAGLGVGYRVYLRGYRDEGSETVCYGVPEGR
jgi:FkbM family methyltransferase